MIIIMKGLSLIFDAINNNRNLENKTFSINFLDYLSYMISINTGIFGPWISFEQHIHSFKEKKLVKLK